MNPRSTALYAVTIGLFAFSVVALAHGPTPRRMTETVEIAQPPAAVWAVVGEYGDIADWSPLLTSSEADSGNRPGSERVITFESGGSVTDNLDVHNADTMTIGWRLLREDVGVYPVSSYNMRIVVTEADGGSSVEWSATYFRGDTHNDPPEHLSDAAAEEAIGDYLRGGLDALKARLEG